MRHGRRVLALYSGHFIGEIRIKPYLNALLGRGVIAGYQIADRAMKMEGQHGDYAFTHIWCQRNVSTAQFAFLKAHSHVPIIYDMDDLLTAIPDFVASSKRTMLKRIAWCLQQAKAVTVASDKLKQYLQRGCACDGEQDHRAQERLGALIAARTARQRQAAGLDLQRRAVLSARKSLTSPEISRHCSSAKVLRRS